MPATSITPRRRHPQQPETIQKTGLLPFFPVAGGGAIWPTGADEPMARSRPGAVAVVGGGACALGGAGAGAVGRDTGGGPALGRGGGGAAGRSGARAGVVGTITAGGGGTAVGVMTVASGDVEATMVAAKSSSPSMSTRKVTAPKRISWPDLSAASATRWLSRNVPLALP